MGRYELADAEHAGLGQGSSAGDRLFELGIMYLSGRSVPTDLISAHKWFNLAAMRGNKEAVRYRLEVVRDVRGRHRRGAAGSARLAQGPVVADTPDPEGGIRAKPPGQIPNRGCNRSQTNGAADRRRVETSIVDDGRQACSYAGG